MKQQTSNRLVATGFVIGYLGTMGGLASFAFGHYGRLAQLFVLVPALIIGTTIALSSTRPTNKLKLMMGGRSPSSVDASDSACPVWGNVSLLSL
jgi:hypothetical protein